MEKKKIFYFGNPYIKEDSLAIKVVDKIKRDFKEIEFVYVKDTFQLMDIDFTNSLLIDVSSSGKKVELIDSSKVVSTERTTTHDFDIGFYLKLTGKTAKIIVIPKNYDIDKACNEVKTLITQFHPNLH